VLKGMTEVLWAFTGGVVPRAAGNLGRFSRGGVVVELFLQECVKISPGTSFKF